jgi:hypothetical protein
MDLLGSIGSNKGIIERGMHWDSKGNKSSPRAIGDDSEVSAWVVGIKGSNKLGSSWTHDLGFGEVDGHTPLRTGSGEVIASSSHLGSRACEVAIINIVNTPIDLLWLQQIFNNVLH